MNAIQAHEAIDNLFRQINQNLFRQVNQFEQLRALQPSRIHLTERIAEGVDHVHAYCDLKIRIFASDNGSTR